MSNEVRRPLLITLLGVLYAIAAIIVLILGIALLAMGSKDPSELFSGDTLTQILNTLSEYNITWEQLTQIGGIGFIITAAIYLIFAVGLLKGWLIFWILGLIVNILGLIGCIFGFISTQTFATLIPLAISILLVAYMLSPGVRRFFFS